MLSFQRLCIARNIPVILINQTSPIQIIIQQIVEQESDVHCLLFMKQLRNHTSSNIVSYAEISPFLHYGMAKIQSWPEDLLKCLFQILADVAADIPDIVYPFITDITTFISQVLSIQKETNQFYRNVQQLLGPIARFSANLALTFEGNSFLLLFFRVIEHKLIYNISHMLPKYQADCQKQSCRFVECLIPFFVFDSPVKCVLKLAKTKYLSDSVVEVLVMQDQQNSQLLINKIQLRSKLSQNELKCIFLCIQCDSDVDFAILGSGLLSSNIQKRMFSGKIINRLLDSKNEALSVYLLANNFEETLQLLSDQGEGYAQITLNLLEQLYK